MDAPKSLKAVAVEALVVALVGGVVVGVPATAVGAQISAQITQGIQNQATCDNPQELSLLDGDSITATGEYLTYDTNSGPLSYPPQQLVDGTRSTAWVSADTDRQTLGVGATVVLELPDDSDLRLICVLNGYAKGANYEVNPSVAVVEVTTGPGTRDATLPALTAENAFAYQPLAFAPGVTRTVELKMLVVDPAVTPDDSAGPVSATLSEVELWVSPKRAWPGFAVPFFG